MAPSSMMRDSSTSSPEDYSIFKARPRVSLSKYSDSAVAVTALVHLLSKQEEQDVGEASAVHPDEFWQNYVPDANGEEPCRWDCASSDGSDDGDDDECLAQQRHRVGLSKHYDEAVDIKTLVQLLPSKQEGQDVGEASAVHPDEFWQNSVPDADGEEPCRWDFADDGDDDGGDDDDECSAQQRPRVAMSKHHDGAVDVKTLVRLLLSKQEEQDVGEASAVHPDEFWQNYVPDADGEEPCRWDAPSSDEDDEVCSTHRSSLMLAAGHAA